MSYDIWLLVDINTYVKRIYICLICVYSHRIDRVVEWFTIWAYVIAFLRQSAHTRMQNWLCRKITHEKYSISEIGGD